MSDRLTYLTATSYTVDDLHRRIGIWRTVLEHELFQRTDDRVAAHQEALAAIGRDDDRAVVAAWDPAVWEGVTAATLAHEAESLIAAAAQVPTRILYLPVSLDAAELAALGVWCRTELGITLLDIKIDPQVVGGAAFVAADDTYHEFSLRSKLKAAPGTITSLMTNYGTS